MRILCLHGYGTSAAIFRMQLDGLIREMDASYEFVFFEGEHECPKGQGIGNLLKGPFFCYNKSFGPEAIQDSLDQLQAFIDDEGPFDGIIGFSQGGSLALSYLLQEASARDTDSDSDSSTASSLSSTRPSFQFAVFLSTIVAFSPDVDFCSELLEGLSPADHQLLRRFPHDSAATDYGALSGPPERAIFFQSLGRVLDTALRGGFIAPDTELGLHRLGTSKVFPRCFHPQLLSPDMRVRIPTVHVVGRKDDAVLVELSRTMEKVCEPGLTRLLTHEGGHDVPRGGKDLRALVSAIEWAVYEGLRQA